MLGVLGSAGAAICLAPCGSALAESNLGQVTQWDGRVRLLVKYERRNRRSDRPLALLRSTVYNSSREGRRGSGLARLPAWVAALRCCVPRLTRNSGLRDFAVHDSYPLDRNPILNDRS